MGNIEKLVEKILCINKEDNTARNWDDELEFICPYCFHSTDVEDTEELCVLDELYHEPDCIVLLAKKAVKEL